MKKNDWKYHKWVFVISLTLLIALMSGCRSIPTEPLVIINANVDLPIGNRQRTYAVSLDGSETISLPLIEKLEEPQWSPDKCWIVFSTRFSEAYGGGNPEIYLMTYDGHQTIRVTNKLYSDIAPSWSPDGKSIVYFSSYSENSWGIYLLEVSCFFNRKGCNPQAQFLVKGKIAKWSPVSDEILVQSKDTNGKPVLYIYDVSLKKLIDLGREGWSAVWSPDGEKIAYRDYLQKTIVIIDKDGKNQYVPMPDDSTADDPIFTSDGRYLVFSSEKGDYGRQFKFDQSWDSTSITRGVFKLELSTGNITQLSSYKNEMVYWLDMYPGAPDVSCTPIVSENP